MATIAGRLDSRGQPIIDLQFIGTRDTITAMIDTGDDGEVLCYHGQLTEIGTAATFTQTHRVRLADGTEVFLLVSRAMLDCLGRPRPVNMDVVAGPSPRGARCLVGCRLLADTRLEIDFPQSDVRISRD